MNDHTWKSTLPVYDSCADTGASRSAARTLMKDHQMDDTLVEKVAKAICRARGIDPDATGYWQVGPGEAQWISLKDLPWRRFQDDARAAISAIETQVR